MTSVHETPEGLTERNESLRLFELILRDHKKQLLSEGWLPAPIHLSEDDEDAVKVAEWVDRAACIDFEGHCAYCTVLFYLQIIRELEQALDDAIPREQLKEHETQLVEIAAKTANDEWQKRLKQVGWCIPFEYLVHDGDRLHEECAEPNNYNCHRIFIIDPELNDDSKGFDSSNESTPIRVVTESNEAL